MENKELKLRMTQLNQTALLKFGFDRQIHKCIEEMSELISELARFNSFRVSYSNIYEEIADVIITTDQMIQLFGDDEIENALNHKLDKLEKLLKPGANPTL